jgi:hypothetical protein
MHLASDPEKIAYIKQLRSELHAAEKELFSSLHNQPGLHEHHEQKMKNSSLLVLIGASVFMIAFVLSGVVIKPNMSETYTTVPTIHLKAPNPNDCAQNDGDFESCVTGQQQGSGCSWYAACSKCIPDTDKDSHSICN